jgi:hypothetical protein
VEGGVWVEGQGFPDDVRIGAELPSPEPIAEDDQVGAGSGIARIEYAA